MRRGAIRRSACLAGALAAASLCTPALAVADTRIINGSRAEQGEYPAQGFLRLVTSDGTYSCGGTLVSNRHFLTAAHCATEPETETALPASAFTVRLGSVDRTAGTAHTVSQNQVHAGYDISTLDNDAALLTLTSPASPALTPLRLVETGETSLWQPTDIATIIGWGRTDNTPTNQGSQFLLEAQAPIRSDAYCSGPTVYGADFNAATMVCAGDGSADTCGGDSGGPLMVSDGAFLVLTGITSWGDLVCNHPTNPGVYTRLGAPALNAWVRDRVPMVRAGASDTTPAAAQEVSFSATARHPGVTGYFTSFSWDFNSDGVADASGNPVSHSYPADGNYVARVLAGGAGADTATDRVAVRVGEPAPTPEPTPEPTATPTPTPTATVQPTPTPIPLPRPVPPTAVVTPGGTAATGPLATILVTGRPRVRRSRFNIRIAFARTAPAGTAVVEVLRGRRIVAVGRTRVLRGGTRRVSVKLNARGRRLLARSTSRRLRASARVRVGRRVLRSKTLTVRR